MDLPGTGYHFAGCLLCCIVSGAYFGDEMSPLSDTTNLAPAIADSTLFDHIRHMVWTTGPSLMGGVILGVICMAFQGIVDPKAYMLTLNYGFVSENVNPDLVELLSGGGMQNMMWTISLIMCAMVFGGIVDLPGRQPVGRRRLCTVCHSELAESADIHFLRLHRHLHGEDDRRRISESAGRKRSRKAGRSEGVGSIIISP